VTRARSLGSAHRGLTAFLVQRVTSIYLAGFTVYLIAYLLLNPITDHASWSAYFNSGIVRLVWAMFFISVLAHVWVGMRSIYMDYVHATWLRFTISLITAFVLIALALWSADILLWGSA
jgi:succinate dehydrogenase / fumarate reductase, membrane anchor subunit